MLGGRTASTTVIKKRMGRQSAMKKGDWESKPSLEVHSKPEMVNGRQLGARELD